MTSTCSISCPDCSGTGIGPSFEDLSCLGKPNTDVCSFCGGTGNVAFCKSKGIESDVLLEVKKDKGSFAWARLHCRSWNNLAFPNGKLCREWGYDHWSILIEDRQDALDIWRLASSYKIFRAYASGSS